MHRHDADLVARNFHVALHFEIGRAQPRHKALQRGRRLAFVVQRQFQKLIERVVRLVSEPPQDSRAAAVAAEQPGIERKRRLAGKAALALFEPPQRIPQPAVGRGALSQCRAQRSLALPGDLEQVVIG